MRAWAVPILACAFSATMAGAQSLSIPPGTVIPVRLATTIDANHCQPGQTLKARVAQDVPLYNGSKIKAGTPVLGEVLSATPPENSRPASITFRFDQIVIRKQPEPVTMHLRALASPDEVQQAKYPTNIYSERLPFSLTTVQIGGHDVVYRGGGPVSYGLEVVGKPIEGAGTDLGVLSRVSPYPGKPCHGPVAGNNHLQALWLFSHDACGVYGYDFVNVRTPQEDAKGLIVLRSCGDTKLAKGSALLLRVNAPDADLGKQ